MSVEKELGWEIGIDIGGTFTDIVLRSSSEVLSTKVLTSSEAPVVPVISGIKKLACIIQGIHIYKISYDGVFESSVRKVSKISKIAPIVIAESAILNAGQYKSL